MTKHSTHSEYAPRQAWLAVLARASLAELEGLVPTLGELPPLEQVRPPEIGMVMLRGRVGGTGDAFNFGEASLTRCALRVAGGPLGVGYTLGRDRRKAELMALLDALLQDPARQTRLQQEVIAPLATRQAQQATSASRAAASSKVEFFTMVRGEA
ncbi:MAG: phosphonate C-P lyase system protein PhnG [Gammaproteobacteria bacterium]|jgi:alpha-D-ribose 1-methylphosphonate 5-triphosphate synthase subunit PhnG|nr:phosphonate C-P lyase system protein PhnG [Gammaproteobacteria bacterium]MBU0788220.1 phosphonate C-P lyase system protein PhnG [Gammaproteobacteria bacterium]MBU0815283.1 phosphonate C-P lyase system protein PhnG [Gammaproteobacteria bacterium]MBU1785609.1 phosphonate C-P lyase system protein PhnG [Gammaproteobacteria bacterium]